MWIRVGGDGQPMWIIFKFYNIIIKSANVDKGGGGKTLIHKMWIKIRCFFLTPPLPSASKAPSMRGLGDRQVEMIAQHLTALCSATLYSIVHHCTL